MFSLVSFGTFAIGVALGYKIGFFYGFRCGREDQAVAARIAEKSRIQPSGGKGSRLPDPWG